MCPRYAMQLTPATARYAEMAQVFDNYAVTVMIGDDPYTLGLFDTAGARHMHASCPRAFADSRLSL